MTHTCPVCGWPHLDEPPADHEICPCCGTQFDYDDMGRTHAELRQAWVDSGAQWWANYETPPDGWDAQEQLRAVA